MTLAAALLLSLCAAALFLRGTLADLLLSALGGGSRLVMSRRSTALIAHAILLVVLRDAGVLSAPAARRRRRRHDDQQLVVVQAATNKAVVAARCAARVEVEEPEATTTKEMVLVEKWAPPTGDEDDHIARRHRVHRPAVAVQVAADDRAALVWPTATRTSGGEGGQAEEEESVDEMNKRFDKFIADMRRNMQLEALQLLKDTCLFRQ